MTLVLMVQMVELSEVAKLWWDGAFELIRIEGSVRESDNEPVRIKNHCAKVISK